MRRKKLKERDQDKLATKIENDSDSICKGNLLEDKSEETEEEIEGLEEEVVSANTGTIMVKKQRSFTVNYKEFATK